MFKAFLNLRQEKLTIIKKRLFMDIETLLIETVNDKYKSM